jgi:TonB family protein
MIPRTLVPRNIRPAADQSPTKPPRRFSSSLDTRTVIPSNLPIVPLDGRTAIPSHVPFEVLAQRVVVPRDTPAKVLEGVPLIPDHVPLSVLDSRVVVPAGLPPSDSEEPLVPHFELSSSLPFELLEMREPDVITTGEVNLLAGPAEERDAKWKFLSRVLSLVVHFGLIIFVLATPKLFPTHTPTQEEMDLARRQLSFIYLPPDVTEVPKIAPRPQPPSPVMRVDPRVLRKVAPTLEPQPLPGPVTHESAPAPPNNLPAAPTPQPSGGLTPAPRSPQPSARLEPVKPPEPNSSLVLPSVSPGKALEDSMRSALQGQGGQTRGFADPLPPSPGGGGGGGGQPGYLGGNIEMLTPTEGVDFTNYLTRLLASVKRNWYAIIPESARLGDRGRVIIRFKITRDGNVPFPEPLMERTSGKEPLDRAAMAAIRASSPFEPLPPAFSGPYIELRFMFLYNLPLDYRE